MAILRNTHFQGLMAWLLALTQTVCVLGCRQSTGGGGGGAGTTAPGATTGVNLGEIAYSILHHNYETAGETGKASALEARKDDFVSSINRILPPSAGQNLFPTLLSFLPLVDDGTVEGAMTDVDAMMQDMMQNQAALDGLAKLLGGASHGARVSDNRSTYTLISRMLAYPEMESLARALLALMRAHDGLDDQLNPNPAERDLLAGLQGMLSRQLLGYQPGPGSSQSLTNTLQKLSDGLLASEPLAAWSDLGAPAWAVRLDKNGNPKVLPDTGGTLPPPFVDADRDGAADVGSDGRPVDSAGTAIDIAPFGSDGARDSYGRALVSGGATYYDYFDLKRTMLSELLLLTSELLQKDVLGKGVKVVAALTDRVRNDNGTPDPADDYDTLAPDSPILDLVHAQLELVKATPLPEVLKGIAEVIKQDPAKFSDMLDTLLVAVKTASNAASQVPPPAAGASQALLDDLLPMLEAMVQGNNTTLRSLLQAFNTEQRRLRTLPRSFALMMKWNDYGRRIPTSATAPSVMQQLLGMMERANACNVIGASPNSNMAEFYLDAMAGNARILGFNISIGTINQLVDISLIRRLLCSGITEQDVRALKAFNDTGALEAMKPIAKVFSDRGQTRLLKDVMLGLGRHYDRAMRPTEPTVVAVLESGAVEKLFEVLDQFTQVRVPGSTEVVADVIADTAQALIQARPVTDRRGVQHRSLFKLVLSPLDSLSQKATARGVKPELDAIFSALGETIMATYVDTRGTADPADDVTRWKWGSLKTHLARVLELGADMIPAAADRPRWAAEQMTSIEQLLGGRDTVFVLDVLEAIAASPEKQTINAAIANLFTPRQNAAEDAFGGVLIMVAEILAKKPAATSTVDAQALADVLHWAGGWIDPAAARMRGMGKLVMKLIAADDGLFLLHTVRNAFDMGPNGADKPAVQVLQDVMSQVSAAGNPSSGPMTGASLRDMMQGMHDFMNDPVNGMPAFVARIKARTNR